MHKAHVALAALMAASLGLEAEELQFTHELFVGDIDHPENISDEEFEAFYKECYTPDWEFYEWS